MTAWVLGNWPLKVASLAAAMAVWFFVANTEKSRLVVAAPLEWIGIGDDRVMLGPRPDTVDVELEAVRWMASHLDENVRVRVNLAGFPAGESVVVLTPSDVQAPRTAAVTRVTPARIRVTLASALRHRVRVAPDVTGAPAPGFRVGQVTVEPSSVQIKGPRFTIEGRDTVATAPVDVSGSRQTFSRVVGLVLPDAVEPAAERSVRVTVEIRPEETMQQQKDSSR